MRESALEKKFVARCKELNVYQRKWSSPGRRGVPDRIVLYKGQWAAIELKAPGKKPSKLQQFEHVQIRKNDGLVWVIDNEADIDYFLRKLISGGC